MRKMFLEVGNVSSDSQHYNQKYSNARGRSRPGTPFPDFLSLCARLFRLDLLCRQLAMPASSSSSALAGRKIQASELSGLRRWGIRYFRLLLVLASLFAFTGCGGKKSGQVEPPVFRQMTVLKPEAPGKKTLGSSPLVLDISNTDHGYLTAQAEDNGKMKNIQLVHSESGVNYSYFLHPGENAVIPFTDGEGTYTITCYEQIEESQYAALFIDTLEVKLLNPFYPFLYPNQYVNFTPQTEACILAQKLLPEGAGELEGLDAIYDYVVNNVTYDMDKAQTVETGYLPDVDTTLRSGTGICFDYAALMTAMLRARDIPCRLVTGYAGTVKHAWIDVYSTTTGWVYQAISFDGEEWNRMDPTFYSSSTDEEFILSYIGDGTNYNSQYAH